MFLTPLCLLIPAAVQDPAGSAHAPMQADPQTAPQWSASIHSYWMDPPHTSGYLSAIFAADRGPLHLEARWAYEDRDTGSLFAGWSFPWEGSVRGSVTPMLGLACGRTDGVVPALSLELDWKSLQFTSDVEYLIGTSQGSRDFLYSWNELTWSLSERFSVGLVGQRTNVFDQELSIDRGVLFGATLGKTRITAYLFNPDRDDPYLTLAVGGGF